jgi:hypothetical protein
MHRKDALIDDILEWPPYDHVTQTVLMSARGAPKILRSDAIGSN